MPIEWTMVRVKQTTRARLERLRNSLVAAYERHHPRIGDLAEGLSLDALLNRLLDAQEKHVKRARKSNKGRSARRRITLTNMAGAQNG